MYAAPVYHHRPLLGMNNVRCKSACHKGAWFAGGDSLNLLIASSVTGVKRLTRLPSGSRNRMERFPQGMVVGSCTHSRTTVLSRSNSLSTSSTRNSMITVWLSAGRAELLKSCAV
jgi:hypothetical protein